MTTAVSKKEQLQTQLKEVGDALNKLSKQFNDIKDRTKTSVKAARKRSDERQMAELRSKLGI